MNLPDQARDIARSLTYNGREIEAQAKQTLLELAHALDARTLRVHRKREGLLLVNAHGRSRYLTWRERLAYWIAGVLPGRV